MTNPRAIYATSEFLRSYLQREFEREKARPGTYLSEIGSCTFSLLASNTYREAETASLPRITLYLYRLSVNEHLRNRPRPNHAQQDVPLPLDLHYLLTVWADKPQDEQILVAWAAQQFYLHPLLDAAVLDPKASWERGDQIQVVPAGLSQEDLLRIWEILQSAYRLSIPYVARLVRIDREPIADGRPVVASRFVYSEGIEP